MSNQKLSYHVEGRNNYYAIDEHLGLTGERFDTCQRNITVFKTKKQALEIAGYMNDLAYQINVLKGAAE